MTCLLSHSVLLMLISLIQMTIWAESEHQIPTREFISSLEIAQCHHPSVSLR